MTPNYVPVMSYVNHYIQFLSDLYYNTYNGWDFCVLKELFPTYIINKIIQIFSWLSNVEDNFI